MQSLVGWLKQRKAGKVQFWLATRVPHISKASLATASIILVGASHAVIAYCPGIQATAVAFVGLVSSLVPVTLMMSRAYLPMGNGAYLYVSEPYVWGVHLLRPELGHRLPRPTLLVDGLESVWPYVRWGNPRVLEISSPLLVKVDRNSLHARPHIARITRLEHMLRKQLVGLDQAMVGETWLSAGNSLLVLRLNKQLHRLIPHSQVTVGGLVRLPSASLRFELSTQCCPVTG